MAKKVLIVEDDFDFATSLELALDLIGYQAIIAASAEIAQTVMAEMGGEITVGFFDIKLQGQDGIGCYEQIRETYPDFTGIVMTGFRDETLFERARSVGIVEVLRKPFRMARFMELVRRYAEA